MDLVAELSQDVAAEYREKQKTKLQRTFVKASEAASSKAKGIKNCELYFVFSYFCFFLECHIFHYFYTFFLIYCYLLSIIDEKVLLYFKVIHHLYNLYFVE